MSVDVVVVGLGYVGLPLAHAAATAGMSVVGYDTNPAVVAAINAGHSHIHDVPDDALDAMLSAGFRATTDERCLSMADAVIACVPTPLSVEGGPDLRAVIDAADKISRHLHKGALVVLESTTHPGTTDEIVRPILERHCLRAGVDFALAFSPERINPGNPTFKLTDIPKVVGGHTPSCTARASSFYQRIFKTVVPAKGTREAEMSKLLENTYRQVNIALVNELTVLCHELGIDIWDVIACAATKPFGFQPFRPSAGVGGHCIPIDPRYLSYKAHSVGCQLRLVDIAHEINSGMPAYLVHRAEEMVTAAGLTMRSLPILLLGVTYKPNTADQRETPAAPITRQLRQLGAVVSFYDPYVSHWQVDGIPVAGATDLSQALQHNDVAILLQDHEAFDFSLIAAQAHHLLDTCGRISGPHVATL